MRFFKNRTRRARRLRVHRLPIVGLIAIVIGAFVVVAANATPSSFLELDGNVISNGTGTYDWANSGALTTTNNVYSRAGSGGVFDGGVFNGATTPPTAPPRTPAAAADGTIADAEFKVDPLSVDTTACGTGDPTAYTGAGSETNGDLLTSDTYGTASIPNKDDLSNVYALAHVDGATNEVFFGAERVINNGDSHIDFEFLQSDVSKTGTCSGSFVGDRTAGDFLLAVDFTTGGTLGGTTLYKWTCPGITDGNVCNPAKKSGRAYVSTGTSAVVIKVNDAATGNIGCGGWVCRNPNGTATQTILTNELMEGGIDLAQLGFTGCVSTFLPHTRSSQSFTAVLKDFEIIPFNTCKSPTVTTSIVPAGPLSIGSTAHDTATLHDATADAGGTITYKLYDNSTCTGPELADLTPTVNTVVNGSVPDSKPFTFNSAGTFYFYAEYSGDARNSGPVNSGCAEEPLVISPNTPAVSTTIVPAGPLAVGATAHDTATITGATANAGGTITYTLFDNSTCTGPALADLTPTINTVVNGVAPASKSFTFNSAGTFYFYAEYSGDANNTGPVNSGCASEPLVISPNTPAVSTTIVPAGPLALGAEAHDTADITGETADAGGTITYTLFDNSTCTGPALADLTPTINTVVNGVAPASKSFTFNSAGTFYFYAEYSGDANNTGPVNSGCASEPLVINPNTPAPHSTPVVQIKDTFSVDGFSSGATGNVVVSLYSDATCTTQLDTTSFPIAGNLSGGTLTDETTFTTVLSGSYFYQITYAGDGNNQGFTSACTDESAEVSITSLP